MNESGKIINSISKSYDVSYLKDGWVELAKENCWNGTKESIKELLNKGEISEKTSKATYSCRHI